MGFANLALPLPHQGVTTTTRPFEQLPHHLHLRYDTNRPTGYVLEWFEKFSLPVATDQW